MLQKLLEYSEYAAGRTTEMEQSVPPSKEASVSEIRARKPHKERTGFSALGLRTRSILYGIVAAAILTLLIAVGSRGFHWFDSGSFEKVRH